MTAKEPIIRFSPFEALLIGEKNRILKRQPMKNTIFVTRLNQRSKTINLRDLFGPEKTTKTKYNDVIFKMPQRVCDFLRHRRSQNTSNESTNNDGEVLCYEFEGHKMLTKNNKTLLTESKNIKVKPAKVKFKRKFKCKDNFHGRVVKKFASGFESKYKSIALKSKINSNSNRKRHLLRGKDGKFIRKSDYEKLKFKDISPKQKYLSNYLHQLYLKRNKQLFHNSLSNSNENSSELEMSFSVETIVGLPYSQFDIKASETMLNQISKTYYENNCHEDFKFPKFPNQLEPLDFENDSYLTDLIYENFPKVLKFQSQSQTESSDFSEALFDCKILKQEKIVKMYEKKKNGFVKDEEIRELLNRRFPLIKLKRINDIMPNHCHVKNERNLFPAKIDEPYTKKNHLITGKSFGSFFFKSAEGKDIFIGNLMKPFWQNSWFGSLPES